MCISFNLLLGDGRPKNETCFLPGQLNDERSWPSNATCDWLSGCGSNTKSLTWEADILSLSYRRQFAFVSSYVPLFIATTWSRAKRDQEKFEHSKSKHLTSASIVGQVSNRLSSSLPAKTGSEKFRHIRLFWNSAPGELFYTAGLYSETERR